VLGPSQARHPQNAKELRGSLRWRWLSGCHRSHTSLSLSLSLSLYRASEDGSFARFGNGLEVQERALAFLFFSLVFHPIGDFIHSFINWDDAEIFIHFFCRTTMWRLNNTLTRRLVLVSVGWVFHLQTKQLHIFYLKSVLMFKVLNILKW